jgi:ABC-type spermidine/putrescine transport system permease subunit I
VTATLERPPVDAGRRSGRSKLTGPWLLLVPTLLFLAIFFLWPMVQMARESFADGAVTYGQALSSPVYRRVFWTTAKTAGLVTLICLLLGFPYAYVMHRASRRMRTVLLAAVLLPFWSSLLVRSFAWIALLQDSGLINQTLRRWGVIDQPVPMIRTEFGVLLGMVHIMLPYMVLPLFATMLRIDDRVLAAATSLGASPWRRFRRVFVPLSGAGVFAGTLLVFTISLGFYITPALLGGPRQTMVGEVIADEVQQYALPTASALGMILLIGTMVLLGVVLIALSKAREKTS